MVLLDAVVQDGDHDALAGQPLPPDLQDVQVWPHLVVLCQAGRRSAGPSVAWPAPQPAEPAHHVPLLGEPGVRGHRQGALHAPPQSLLLEPPHLGRDARRGRGCAPRAGPHPLNSPHHYLPGGPSWCGTGSGTPCFWVPMCLGTCPCTPPSGHSLYYPQRRAGHVLHTHLLPVLPLPALPLVSSLLKSSHGSPPPSPGPTAPCLSVPHQPLSAVAAAATSPGPLHMLCLPGAALPPSWLICPLSPRTSSCLPPPCQQSGPVSPHWLCSHLESRPLIISLCPTRLTRGQALASCQPRLQPAPLLCCHPSRGASNSQAFSFLNPLLAHTPW